MPLQSSLVCFWKTLHTCDRDRVRIGCVTPSGLLDFTEEEATFVDFVEQSLQTHRLLNGSHTGNDGLVKAMSFLRKMKWAQRAWGPTRRDRW